jgi:N-hydroxyarylamine O-acetyltransferase
MSDIMIDLPAYLARIGYAGPLEPNLGVLRSLVAHHSAVIPFENIDVVLGRPIELGVDALQRKMVRGGRGGYCFEQNSLLKAALEATGFRSVPLLARVVRGMPADAGPPRGHMILRVELPEGSFLADVGFGNLTPTAPLALRTGVVQETLHEPFRLMPMGTELLLEALVDGEWGNVYRLSLEPQLPIDLEAANWFTFTRPGALFRENVVAARPGPGVRTTLFNGRMAVRQVGGGTVRTLLDGAAAYRDALVDQLGLALTEEEVAEVAAASARFAERSPGRDAGLSSS